MLCALAALAPSCRRERTSILIVVNTDFVVPSEVGELHVDVEPEAPGGSALRSQIDFVIGGRREQGCVDTTSIRCLPLSFAVEPRPDRPEGAPTRVTITARRVGAGTPEQRFVLDRAAVLSFQPARSLAYGMFLPKACVAGRDICAAQGLVCTERGCESRNVDPNQLVPYTPGGEQPIARPPDDGGPNFDVNATDASDAGAIVMDAADGGRRGDLSLTVGNSHACVLRRSTGQVYCWGENDFGQLGRGFISSAADGGLAGVATPAPLVVGDAGALRFVGVVAGRDTTCGFTADNSVYCWGRDDATYTGFGGPSATPLAVQGLVHPPGSNIVSLAHVNNAHFIQYSNGAVVSFGARYDSAAADGPSEVPLLRAPGSLAIAALEGARSVHSQRSSVGFAIGRDGQLLGWGHIHDVRLGSLAGADVGGGRRVVGVPTAIPGAGTMLEAFASDSAVIALRSDRRVSVWGNNESYFVDPEAETDSVSFSAPTIRADIGDGPFRAVALVGSAGLAINESGALRCFGARYNKICPDAVPNDVRNPATVTGFAGPAPRFVAVSGGFDFACALSDDDRVYCWGGNESSQCGAPASRFVEPTAPNRVIVP